MLGLTFDKLLLIGLLAAFLLGPDRIPAAAQALARIVKAVKRLADQTKDRVREEMGPEFDEVDWKKLDPRQYDPRRIVSAALSEPVGVRPTAPPASRTSTFPEGAAGASRAEPATARTSAEADESAA
jgi:sec-independent protein translocase protein TatB